VIKVLFVDDEPRILTALQILLRRNREQWNMAFEEGGQAALARLQAEHFDVIVSDMRMPGIDGAALLKAVRDNYPHMLRIVLSAYTELEFVLRVVPVSHQFLTKPCEVAVLENAINGACAMQQMIPEEGIRKMVGRINRLASLPSVHSALIAALEAPEATATGVAQVLNQDMAMCAKLLQLVNSSFFQIARRIISIEEAVIYLGFNMVKSLVLSLEVFQIDKPKLDGFSIDALQRHSLLTANIAAELLQDKESSEDAFMAGLLHDIGKLIFAQEYPDHVERLRAQMRTHERPEYCLERDIAGVTHAEVGAYLLGLWGLPDSIVRAVANHHMPSRDGEQSSLVLAAVHFADHAAKAQMQVLPNGAKNRPGELDRSYLAAMGVSNQLTTWRQIATEQIGLFSARGLNGR
jgi:putative nucleotidyltransferase with HDIG domain